MSIGVTAKFIVHVSMLIGEMAKLKVHVIC